MPKIRLKRLHDYARPSHAQFQLGAGDETLTSVVSRAVQLSILVSLGEIIYHDILVQKD